MGGFQHVLVALARTAADRELLPYARALARSGAETKFSFVHVLDWAGSDRSPLTPVTHGQALAEIRALAGGESGAADFRVLSGNRVDCLLEYAVESGCDLIVAGHRSGRSGRRALARRLAMKAPCSLCMAPEGSPGSIQRVVAAVDFSPHSALAVTVAAGAARRLGLGECLALHALLAPDAEERESSVWHRFLAPLDLGGVTVRPLTVRAPSVTAALAGRGGLVVMGARGRTEASSILLGGEVEQTLMETDVPVLVVRKRGEQLGLLQALFDRDFARQ